MFKNKDLTVLKSLFGALPKNVDRIQKFVLNQLGFQFIEIAFLKIGTKKSKQFLIPFLGHHIEKYPVKGVSFYFLW